MFAGIIFADNGALLEEEIEEDTASTAFCCVPKWQRSDPTPSWRRKRRAGEEEEERVASKEEDKRRF